MAEGISSKAASRAGVSAFLVLWFFVFWYAQLAKIINTIKSWSPIAATTQGALTPAVNQTGDGFELSLQQTLKWEGSGCEDHPADIGGLTCKGILDSEYRTYREKKGLTAQSVTQMSDEEMKEIYRGYWDRCNAGSKPMPLAFAIFDSCVNFDENKIRDWFENLPDDPKQAALTIMDRRIQYRHQRAAELPSQSAFLQGWLNRDNDAKQFIEAYQAPIATTTIAAGAAPSTDPRQSVLKVKGAGFGTCFIAAPSICVTNAHVVGRESVVSVSTIDGKQFQASVLKKGTEGPTDPDVAILKIQGGEALPVLPAATPQQGSMQLIGYAYGKEQSVVSGQIQQIGDRRILYSGENQPGKSGSPILQNGGWVALNAGQYTGGGQGSAVRPEIVNQFLQSATQIPTVQARKSLI